MYYSKVEICGVDTSKLKVLSDEEKRALLLKAREGDGTARQNLIDGNLRLVLSIIQRFANRGEDADDLFQVGCIGLIKAVDNFNTALDVKFSTYAVPMIIGEVRRYLRDNNSIRVSRSLRDIAYKALQAKEKLSATLGHEPTLDDIVKALAAQGFSFEKTKVADALEAIAQPVSLFEPIFGEGEDSVYVLDQIGDVNSNDEKWLENISLEEAIGNLGEREKKIIAMRFFAGKTQMEIADEIGISQAQVSRLEKGALQRIKEKM